jgi:hypothetical protein
MPRDLWWDIKPTFGRNARGGGGQHCGICLWDVNATNVWRGVLGPGVSVGGADEIEAVQPVNITITRKINMSCLNGMSVSLSSESCGAKPRGPDFP